MAVFVGSSISETIEAPPTKIVVRACDIYLYLHDFLSQFQSIKFFDDHGLYHGQKGNLAVFEGSSISETGEAPLTKIDVHVCDINLYLYECFEPIPIN